MRRLILLVASVAAVVGLSACDQNYADQVCTLADATHPEIPGVLYYKVWDPGSPGGQAPHVNCGWNDHGYIRWGCYYPTPDAWVYPCPVP